MADTVVFSFGACRDLFDNVVDSPADIITINFTAQKIRAIDDVPEDLWSKFIETGNDNMPYYINLENISKNIYMINGLASPIMVCSSEQN